MSLEQYIAHLNSLAFWKEFTFSQNKFTPRPGTEYELADNVVWFGDYALVLQLKERINETENVNTERSWFQSKVLKKATGQVRDTLRFLREHDQIRITNERGHSFDIRGEELAEIKKIVVYRGGSTLPEDCQKTRYHMSKSEGFVHIIELHQYVGILQTLRLPRDIASYLDYRERIGPKIRGVGIDVDESDIMGAFIANEDIPSIYSRKNLEKFVQDIEDFDLSSLIGNLHAHIEDSEEPYAYYQIMLQFARIPRSVSRAIKSQFVTSVDIVRKKESARPFRLIYPNAECAFMIAPFAPQFSASGREGEIVRIRTLKNLTYASMYSAKMSTGVGILISKDGNHLQIDWCLLNIPWEPDLEMEVRLAHNNPFRVPSEVNLRSFKFLENER